MQCSVERRESFGLWFINDIFGHEIAEQKVEDLLNLSSAEGS